MPGRAMSVAVLQQRLMFTTIDLVTFSDHNRAVNKTFAKEYLTGA